MKLKINTLSIIIFLFINTFLQAQVETFVVRNTDLGLTYKYPEESAIYKKALDLLDKSQRVEIIGDNNKTAVATHILEVEPSVAMKDDAYVATFIDSISTAKVRIAYTCNGWVTMIATNVQSGTLTGVTTLSSPSVGQREFAIKYAALGHSKGVKYEGEIKTKYDKIVRSLYAKELAALEVEARKGMVSGLSGTPAYSLFPYRLFIKEIAEEKKEDAKKVFISGDSKADLEKRDRLVVYTVKEKVSGKRKFEQFEILGRLKYEKDDVKGGFCDVLRGESKIYAAMKEGKKLYCTYGFTPYTKADETNNVKLAVAINYPPRTPQKEKDALYRRIRMDLASRQNIVLIEREKFSKLVEERELQKSDKFIDNQAVEQFKSLGADLILEVGFGSSVDKYNTSSMTYTMSLIDVTTSELQGTQTNPWTSGSVAYANVYASSFIKEYIPPVVNIVEITDGSKDRADDVLIVGDVASGYGKMEVYRRRMIEVDGETLPRFEKIGLVALRAAEGEGIYNAKVKEGGKEIFAAMQAGDAVICMEKAGFLEKMLTKSAKLTGKMYGY